MNMKITYNKNPLYTTIDLDEKEKKELWYKIKISEMEELLSSAAFALEEKYFDLEEAKRAVNTDYYYPENDNEQPNLDKRCDMLLAHYLEALKSYHVGDCTCVPCSCEKCHAEAFLGIDTTKGLGKHSANKINGAFGKDNTRTIDEAIESLSTFVINPENYTGEAWKKMGGYEQHVPRWKAEQEAAHAWLITYKNEHFQDEISN